MIARSGKKALEHQHAQCLADGTAVVGSVDDNVDLFLVAQRALDGGQPSPVMLVSCMHHSATTRFLYILNAVYFRGPVVSG